jgi:hypothetical protein
MGIDVRLRDRSTGAGAKVLTNGQLVVGTLANSDTSVQTMGTANTPVSFFAPISGHKFVVTDILLYANKNVGAGDATVTIYESTDGPATATQSKILLQTEMLKQTSRDLIGLNLAVSEGSWLNGVTDDDDVFATIMGYYSPLTPGE